MKNLNGVGNVGKAFETYFKYNRLMIQTNDRNLTTGYAGRLYRTYFNDGENLLSVRKYMRAISNNKLIYIDMVKDTKRDKESYPLYSDKGTEYMGRAESTHCDGTTMKVYKVPSLNNDYYFGINEDNSVFEEIFKVNVRRGKIKFLNRV